MSETLAGNYNGLPQDPGYHNPQVHNLVKDGSGASRSFIDRAYISFSYGGKDIEDFGLISTFNDDGKSGNLYGNFEDITSSYSMLDGQFYWGSHFTNNSLTFNLATDGMTQKQVDDFKYWFRPGQADKELILSEHPNRAILARVAQPPTYTLIPFKYIYRYTVDDTESVKATIDSMGTWSLLQAAAAGVVVVTMMKWTSNESEEDYYTGSSYDEVYQHVAQAKGFAFFHEEQRMDTLYKGVIQLTFIMDNPFWYLKKNYISIEDGLTEDNKKIILEDGIPFQSNVLPKCFYGGNTFFNGSTWGAIASEFSSFNPYNLVNKAVLNTIMTRATTINSLNVINEDYNNTCKELNFYINKEETAVKVRLQLLIPKNWINSNYYVVYSYSFLPHGASVFTDPVYDVNGDFSASTNIISNSVFYPISTQVQDNILFLNGIEWSVRSAHWAYDLDELDGIQIQCLFYDSSYSNDITPIAIWDSGQIIFDDNDAATRNYIVSKNPLLIYSGIAPTYPIITFKLKPQLIDESILSNACYIYAPYNTYATGNNNLSYNSIILENKNGKKIIFKFTIPEIYDSYNQVLNYVNTSYSLSWPEFIDLLKTSIRCAPVRAHAIQVAEYFQSQNWGYSTQLEFKKYMRAMFSGTKGALTIPSSPTFIFNSATGEAYGKFQYFKFSENHFDRTDSIRVDDYEENVGSMVRSNYLIIDEKTQCSNGEPQDWYTISTDYPGELSNFLILYNNMYY